MTRAAMHMNMGPSTNMLSENQQRFWQMEQQHQQPYMTPQESYMNQQLQCNMGNNANYSMPQPMMPHGYFSVDIERSLKKLGENEKPYIAKVLELRPYLNLLRQSRNWKLNDNKTTKPLVYY